MAVSQFKDALRWPTVARTIRPDLGLRKRSHSDISCQTDLTGILCSSDIEITQAKRTLSLSRPPFSHSWAPATKLAPAPARAPASMQRQPRWALLPDS